MVELNRCLQDRDRDTKELAKRAAAHLKSGPAISEVAPALACLWVRAYEVDHWKAKTAVWFMRILLQYVVFRDRPTWNDYHMVRWQLHRDPTIVSELYEHLDKARRKHLHVVWDTGCWMVGSVSSQNPEFRKQWKAELEKRGELDALRHLSEGL